MTIPDEFDSAAARVAGQAPADPLDRAAAAVAQEQRTAVRTSLYGALMENPDMAARAQKLGRQTGIPSDVVGRNLPEVERSAKLDEFDRVLQTSPMVAQWLADPNNAKVAHDDVENLSEHERLFREALASGRASQGKIGEVYRRPSGEMRETERGFFGAITEPVQRGLAQGRRGLTLLFNELGIFGGLQRQRDAARAAAGLPPEGNAELAVRLANQQREIERYPVPGDIARGMEEISGAQTMGAALEAILANPGAVLETTLQSVGASAPSLVGAAAGSTMGPFGTAAGAGLGSFAVEYGNTIQDVMAEKGVNGSDPMAISAALNDPELMAAAREKAVKRGIPIAVFDAITAGLAGRLLAGAKPTALSVGGRAAGELGLQAGGGAAGEATAQAATGEYKPGDILMEAIAELPTAVIEVPGNYRSALARAQEAEQATRAIERMNELAKASKLAQRDPATFEAFVAQAAEGGPVQDVFINANTLMQSGMAEQVAAASPSVAAQLATALATGGDIKIPVAEYAARIAPTEYAQGLLDHLKTEPQGMSRAEAQEFMQSQAEVLKAEVEQALAERQGDDTFKAQAEAVKTEIKTQLDEVARFTGPVNDAYASMVSNFYAVMSAKLGISPQELFQRYPLKVQAEGVAGAQYDQITPEQAMATNVPLELPSDPIFTEAVGNTPGAQITENGLLIDLVRFQKPEQEGAQAIRTGVFYLPTGAATAKHYKKKGTMASGNLYGGSEEFKGQTLIRRPLFVKGATGGKAPEAAYDMLKGKKAYEKMRTDVLNATTGWGVNEAQKIENVQEMLKRYGADPGLAAEIVRNSRGGNLLPYAVQENIVAHAVRESGYDAVVGYSKGKAGASIAEVFDVREQTFPARGMDSEVHDVFNQPAYHGTPHRGIDKFSTDKIGTGEGAQVYGWGLYFASKREIAEWYRRGLSRGTPEVKLNGRTLKGDVLNTIANKLGDTLDVISKEDVLAEIDRRMEAYTTGGDTYAKWAIKELAAARKKLEKSKSFEVKLGDNPGQLYEVDIPEDDTMLLWDKPLSEQPEGVRKALQKLDWIDSSVFAEYTGQQLYEGQVRDGVTFDNKPRSDAQRDASLALAAAGVKGIKYLDGTSRSQGEGSYNYVVFSGDDVAIRNQFYQGQNTNRGAFNPATNTITLLKNADLSTFLHESGHFFLETQFDIAAKLSQEAAMFGADTNKPGEQQLLQDTNALLKWFGVPDLPTWYNLDFEEKRSYHEQFARGFEAYLFEGKAPNIELQGLFQRFRAWLLNVYRELKNLNVELTDEVRSVFDRMLATTDEIKLAEQARSMMPLFTAPEQAGMTVDEFAAYQALGVDATNDAIQDLQARGLRDLAWTRNARGREIKRLQKEAAARRAEVQIEVRREVMSQPVYRAWQFLTGKLTDGDKAVVAPTERPKSRPGPVDESVDSLFVAIAKLGGIDRAQAESQWGYDPKGRSPMPIFGKYLLRREGGLSLDAMGEALSQYGYLPLDQDGRYDLEEKFDAELRGDTQYSMAVNPAMFEPDPRAGEGVTEENVGAGRLDLIALKGLGIPDEIVEHVQNLKMTAKDGIHPDLVAEMFGFSSGDELVRTLAAAQDPKVEIEGLTDAAMLERYGELATPAAIEREADKAIHNDARARFVAAEANALAKATGKPKVLASAAREFARAMIARLKVRDIRPGQYASAEVRAAKAAEKASKGGDLATAAAEKRNQLVNNYATRAAYDAQEEVEKGVRYLKKFDGDIKGLDADYADQINALLERFDLRQQSLKAIDKRTALAAWIESQREQGLEPEIPEQLKNEAFRKSYRDLTVEEFRGLVDTVKQIEHLGRLKDRLLTAADNRAFEAVKTEIVQSIEANAGDRAADTRTPITNLGRALQQVKRFYSAHIKAATWARVMDGGKDGGPMWEYFIRSANERGDMETTMRAEATAALSRILAPVLKLGKMGGKGQFFPSINRSLNREARIALALNTGNQGNLQRLLGGEGWTVAQIAPVLQSLTAAEWRAVQAVWDHFESYRPQIGAKERRVYGREPAWVEPSPFTIKTADGEEITLAGGYYPIKYDPAASQRAEEFADAEGAKRQLQGAFTSATTRRSFTKTRADEVSGRPLLYTLAGLYSGVNDVIHDLAWHEWLIDANRLLRSKSIDAAIRNRYGPEVKGQFKSWVADIAEGDKMADNAGEVALGRLRQGVSAAGLGFNVMSAAIQITGFNQSIVRVGPKWIGKGIAQYIASPIAAAREVVSKSDFMADRARTQFRELNELRNRVQDESAAMRNIRLGTYFMMMRVQKMVDVPTWLGAYEKAIAAGNAEERAAQLADQAVIDSQGSGMTKDLSAIERGGPALKLFTVFYSYMNTAFNMGVARGMTEKNKARLAVDYLMLFTVPAVLGSVLKDALTPGGDDDEDLEALARKLAAEQLSYLMGLMFLVREFGAAAKIVTGAEGAGWDYQGPAGLRAISDTITFAKQAQQGEFDDAFRKAAVNLLGDFTGLPAAQINRSITGTQALVEGETENPAAVLFGYQKK